MTFEQVVRAAVVWTAADPNTNCIYRVSQDPSTTALRFWGDTNELGAWDDPDLIPELNAKDFLANDWTLATVDILVARDVKS